MTSSPDSTSPSPTRARPPPASSSTAAGRRRDHEDVDAALWFVAAALRGGVSPAAVGGRDARGTPIAADDVVSVRAVATQTEWTHQRPPP